MKNEDLQLSYWLVSSRPRLQKLLLGAFIVFDLLLAAFVAFQGTRFFLSGDSNELLIADALKNRVSYAAINPRLQPGALSVTQTAVLGGSDGKYDLVAIVKNPSTRWAIESVVYTFVLDQQTIATGTTSFFPNEERYLAQFQISLARVSPQSKVSVSFSQPKWRRVLTADDLPDVQLRVDDPAYTILSSVPGAQLSQVTAKVQNGSVFALPTVDVTTILMNAGSIVGVGQLQVADVAPLEARPVDIRFYKMLSASNVLVRASVDLADFPSAE